MAHAARTHPLWTGLGSGVLLAVADWLASGVARTPPILVLASLVAGLTAGSLAGAVGVWLARPSLPPGLLLFLALSLEGGSVASKELPSGSVALGLAAVACVALVAFTVAVRRGERRIASVWAALATVPLGAGFAARMAQGPWFHLTAAWLLVSFALWAGSSAKRLLRALPWAALAVLVVHAQGDHSGVLRQPPSKAQVTPAGPSLVLLVVDTLRADELAPDGALERFGREGVVFRQCVSSAPWTLPSVASLLTGLHPSEHGAITHGSRMSASATTLAEILRAQGYATAAFTGGAFVGTAHGLERGFEHFDPSCERSLTTYGRHSPLLWRLAKNRYFPQRWLMDVVDAYRGLEGVLEAATTWAAGVRGRPMLLFLHTYQVHDYYLYEPDFDDQVLATTPAPSARFAGRLWVQPSEFTGASAADLAHYRALYRGRIAALERLFPTLVADLTKLVGEDAVWIVTSDHGEGFDAQRRRIHHGGRLHEDLLRVPLLLRARGRLEPGRVVQETVRSIDVLPTALELLGLPVPQELSGQSLLGPLRGERPFPTTAFAEDRASWDLFAVRKDGWKWIEGPRGGELYHLADDPHETRPLATESGQGLREELSGFRASHPLPSRVEAELDSTTLEHLQALGYAD